MKLFVWYFATAAGSAAAAVGLPLCFRGWLLKCIPFAIGSLLWSGLDTPWTGFLGATAMVPRNGSGDDRFVLVPAQGGTNNLLQEGATANQSGSSAARSSYASGLPEEVVAFLERQNITKVHAAGVTVDLSNEKTVDGKTYREVGGRCPVYGKFIQTYQPNRAPYKNDFLADVPSEAEHKKTGNPLPGGFGMTMVTGSGQRFSPIPMARLAGAPNIITAKTPLGKCAQYAFQTKALSPTSKKSTEYRYPFVYDPKRQLCYLLYLSMQKMMGKKYCSMYGDSGVTWYCFEPMKNSEKNAHLVYGSAYVGENPDEYANKCPNQALAGQRFGVWENGTCVDYINTENHIVQPVQKKEECWAFAFTNDKAASDQPVGYESSADNPWLSLLPYLNSNWPKSHGRGYNYAVFYTESGQQKCVVSDREPTCLNTDPGAVSYTSLGGLEEVTLDYRSPQDEFSACDYSQCTRLRSRVQDGKVLQQDVVPCSEEEQKSCRGNVILISGLAVLGVVVLAAVGGLFYFRKKKASPPHVEAEEQAIAFEEQQKRRTTKQGDLMQEAEPSFWNEAEDEEDQGTTEQTNVMVEEGY